MTDDEQYLREIVDDELDSIDGDAEVWDQLEQEEEEIVFDEHYGPAQPERNDFKERVYKRLLDEFPDYENEDGPRKRLGWSISKRRRIRENIRMISERRKMRCALATACKSLYILNAADPSSEKEPNLNARTLHFEGVPASKNAIAWRQCLRYIVS